jgi:hypothetical protein
VPGKGRNGQSWLLLAYQVPGKPSRLRLSVWREIKRLGAVYLRNSVAVLPATRPAEHELDKLSNTIHGMSGRAVLLSCEVLAGESDIKAAFQSARTDEYDEVTDRCAHFISNLARECEDEQFSDAELDKRTTELSRLRKRLRRVRDRDVFGTEAQQAASRAVAECQQELDAYAVRLEAQKSAERR